MTPPQKGVFPTVALPDEAFFALDAKSKQKLFLEAGDRPWNGLELGGPRVIEAPKHDRLPLLLLMQDSFAHASDIRFAEVAVVVGVDLHSGGARMRRVVEPKADDGDERPRRDAEPERPAPTGAMATARVRDVHAVDLTPAFGKPKGGERYAATAIAFDRRSEPVQLAVTAPVGAKPEIAPMSRENATKLLDELAAKKTGPGVSPVCTVPATMPEEGLRLTVPASWSPGAGPIRVEGVVRVPLGAGEIVASEGPARDAENQSLPDAFAHGLFLLTQKGRSEPHAVPLVVPIRGRAGAKAGDPVAFEFSFDLQRLVPSGLQPGTYCAYLLAGRLATGPHQLVVESR